MKTRNKKFLSSAIATLHLFLLTTIFMVGEGILFGHRYFDETIRIFAGTEIVLSIISIVLIFKEKQIGYVLLTLSVLSTYIIAFGHRIFLWPCDYCSL